MVMVSDHPLKVRESETSQHHNITTLQNVKSVILWSACKPFSSVSMDMLFSIQSTHPINWIKAMQNNGDVSRSSTESISLPQNPLKLTEWMESDSCLLRITVCHILKSAMCVCINITVQREIIILMEIFVECSPMFCERNEQKNARIAVITIKRPKFIPQQCRKLKNQQQKTRMRWVTAEAQQRQQQQLAKAFQRNASVSIFCECVCTSHKKKAKPSWMARKRRKNGYGLYLLCGKPKPGMCWFAYN